MRKKAKSEKNEIQKAVDRIARIEGQLRGIRRMIETKSGCIDIIAQVLAIREAAGALGIELLKNEFICKKESDSRVDEEYLKTLFKVR